MQILIMNARISVIGMEVGPSYGDSFQGNSIGIDGWGTA